MPPRLRRRLGGFPVEIINCEELQPRKGVAYSGIELKTGGSMLSRTRAIKLAGGDEASGEPESLD